MHGFPDNIHLHDRLFLRSRHRVESLHYSKGKP
jgi:hypothetical protein